MATATAESIPTIIESRLDCIRRALAQHFIRTGREVLETCEVLHIRKRKFSTVAFLRVRTLQGESRLVAKTTTHHPENSTVKACRKQAVVEYNILERLYPRFRGVAKCSVPRPVLALPDLDTYVMEYVDGKVLADEHRGARYFASRRGFASLREHYYHCGRWLKHFHDFTGRRVAGGECVTELLERCDFRLRLVEQTRDPRCPRRLRCEVMKFLEQQAARLFGEGIHVTGRHGDFGPWNILAGPQGITVLDFFGYQDDPVPVDIFSILMTLENEARCWTSSRQRLILLRQSFLDGFGSLPPVQGPLLTICESLRRICNVGGCLTQRRGWPRRRLENHFSVKADVAWLLATGTRESLWPGHTIC